MSAKFQIKAIFLGHNGQEKVHVFIRSGENAQDAMEKTANAFRHSNTKIGQFLFCQSAKKI